MGWVVVSYASSLRSFVILANPRHHSIRDAVVNARNSGRRSPSSSNWSHADRSTPTVYPTHVIQCAVQSCALAWWAAFRTDVFPPPPHAKA